ncbi:olfactory receptor 10A7-like [Pyxicephalus adspersus]|uniref:olfactory receptor 10A7-like n=1 Tax=Pyxicephalus adspersus TaxID=30357 RepID=UPI003B5A20D8
MLYFQVLDENWTSITTVHLLGFQASPAIQYSVFFLFLSICNVTICGNLLIITLVFFSKSLHSPMYFFLSQLSVSDILLVIDTLPGALNATLVEEAIISFSDCITQLYFLCMSGGLECLLLTVMAYDRYLAICKPLHYTLMMNRDLCFAFIILCWTLSIVTVFYNILTIKKLQFCGPNIIDHFFCDLYPLLELSCSDTKIVQLESTIICVIFIVIPFFIIIVSYVYIIITILNIPSVTGRQKAFSTCSSHLTVVSTYYGTLICVYLAPTKGQLTNMTKYLSLLYVLVTPLLNPMIYSLRNKDLKNAFVKCIFEFTNKY